MPSLPLSSARGDTPPPSTMAVSAPRAREEGGLPPRFDDNRPLHGRGRNLFPPCPHCGMQNHPANKCWKQFGKPPTAQVVLTPPAPFSPALPNIPAPQYHVTLTSTEYDALPHFVSIESSGTTRVTPSRSLHQILYVPGFPFNLLSISAITRSLPCTITFFPFHYIF